MPVSAWSMPEAIHRKMIECVEAGFPDESCGLIFGDDGALEVVPMENIQNRLHAEDPSIHTRDARTAYQFDGVAMERVLSERSENGWAFRAIYHSHPDHDAYFSETDSAAAALWGEPNFPGVVYLVYSVKNGRFDDLKAFDWSDDTGAFVEVPIEIE